MTKIKPKETLYKKNKIKIEFTGRLGLKKVVKIKYNSHEKKSKSIV